jgi:hypothetical protein
VYVGRVTYGSERHSLATTTQWENLRRQQPRHWSPRDPIYNIVQHDESILAVCSHVDGHICLCERANDRQQNRHHDAARDEQRTPAPVISQPPRRNGGCGVRDRVRGRVEEGFLRAEAGVCEGSGEVEADDVDAVELGEHLHGDADDGALTVAGEHLLRVVSVWKIAIGFAESHVPSNRQSQAALRIGPPLESRGIRAGHALPRCRRCCGDRRRFADSL